MDEETRPMLDIPPNPPWVRLPIYPIRATWGMLGLLVLIWVGMTLYGRNINATEDTDLLIKFGAKVTPLIVQGEYWRLVTAMFLHVGWLHLAMNGMALYVLGPQVGRLYGAGRMLMMFLMAGEGGYD